MTSTLMFDYDEFVHRFRAACAQRGIDPAQGSTSYQVVHVVAEQRRAAGRAECWWQRHDRWLDCPPYHSETEQAAIWNVFQQAYAIMAAILARALHLRRTQMSLRELHQHQMERS